MRRTAIAAALASAAAFLPACSDAPAQECPGEPVARFHFTGARIYAGDAALAGLDPVPTMPDCLPVVGYPDALRPFDGLLAADASTQAAALCRQTGIVLFGERAGTRYTVEGSTSGAVLGSCSPTCSAALRLLVVGDVATDAGGAPTGFSGALVEVMSRVDGDCGSCLTDAAPSCAARYELQGTL